MSRILCVLEYELEPGVDDSDIESYFRQLSDLESDSDNAESSDCDA